MSAPSSFAVIQRRHRWWYDTDALTSLVAALGGNSIVLGAYAANKGVTLVSGAVSQWDDARGPVGFGPSFVQATSTARPTMSGGLIVFDGVQQYLRTTAGIAAITASTDFGVSVGSTLPSPSASRPIFDVASNAALQVYAPGTNMRAYADGTIANDPTSISAEPGLRSVHARRAIVGGNVTAGYQNGGAAEVTAVAAAAASACGAISVGTNRITSVFANISVAFLLVLQGTVTAAQRTVINNYASATWGAAL